MIGCLYNSAGLDDTVYLSNLAILGHFLRSPLQLCLHSLSRPVCRNTRRLTQFRDHISHNMTKPTFALSDQSSLSACKNLGPLATHWAHSEDSDQTGQMPRLIWVLAGSTAILLVLSCRSSYKQKDIFLLLLSTTDPSCYLSVITIWILCEKSCYFIIFFQNYQGI